MTINIYDTINQLEKELQLTDEYKKLEESHQAVMADKEAKEIWDTFRQYQRTLQEKQRVGEEMSPEDLEKFQDLSTRMADNSLTMAFIAAERNVHQIFLDVNRALEKPILKFYSQDNE